MNIPMMIALIRKIVSGGGTGTLHASSNNTKLYSNVAGTKIYRKR